MFFYLVLFLFYSIFSSSFNNFSSIREHSLDITQAEYKKSNNNIIIITANIINNFIRNLLKNTNKKSSLNTARQLFLLLHTSYYITRKRCACPDLEKSSGSIIHNGVQRLWFKNTIGDIFK